MKRNAITSAAKSNRSAPCTNVPLVCPRCPKDPAPFVVCKYQFQMHWDSAHEGLEMPPELAEQLKLHVHEKEWCAIAGVQRGKTAKKCKVAGCPCGGK